MKPKIRELLENSRELSWRNFGRKITFYLPGMFILNGDRGRYPAISITGNECELNCDHCRARILGPMIHATTPEVLVERCLKLEEQGYIGCLISGGSLRDGTLPWLRFVDALARIKEETNLKISVHTGLINFDTAQRLKEAGVDQALIDVIGDDETLKRVYHLDVGIEAIKDSLDALTTAGIPIAPHIVVGLYYGRVKGEFVALGMISDYNPSALVIVSLMPLPGTPMRDVSPPDSQKIAEILATARLKMPNIPISLGCARLRGKDGSQIEIMAIDAGVNRMALWSGEAMERAKRYNLKIEFRKTCCSIE
ncbi:MAG: radical SAM protein [Actinomycetota bacterium]|nr:radical SAM protein [Actinomycetota bacterium]